MPASMKAKRLLKDLRGLCAAALALGFLVLLRLALTQVIALTAAAAVACLVGLIAEWITGLIAGILTYAAIIKLAYFLDVFEMITSGGKHARHSPEKSPTRSTPCANEISALDLDR